MRGILQSAAELQPDVWLTAAQWGKIARNASPVTPIADGSCGAAATDPGQSGAAAKACGSTSCEACRRLAWVDGAARTLMSSYRRGYEMYSEFVPHSDETAGGRIVGVRPRFFSRRECARLMGFPEWFRVDLSFGLAGGAEKEGQAGGGGHVDANRFYAQIGNAVCPPVVTAIAGPLLAALGCEAATPAPPDFGTEMMEDGDAKASEESGGAGGGKRKREE